MVKVLIGNSYSKISGLSEVQMKALRALLSYKVDAQAAFYSGAHRPRLKYMIDIKGNFPSGLWHRVKTFLIKHSIQFESKVVIPAIKSSPSKFVIAPSITPYADQVAAVDAAYVGHRGIIEMPTGTGKSLVIGMLAVKIGLRTLIVVPSLEIKRQLKESLDELFGGTLKVRIENIDSTALPKLKDFDCLIIDEAHHVAAKTYQKLNRTAWTGIYYRYFLTATPFRNNTEETLLFEGIAGQLVYRLTYKDAVAKGYIVPVEAYYYEIPKQKTEAYTWAQVYNELVVNNEGRNLLIATLLARLQHTPTLCLVKEVAHGNNISSLTGSPFANGKDEASRAFIQDFNQGLIKDLVGTTGILGEGVDTKPAEYVIIAGLGKAKSAFMQAVGRGVRRHGDKESAKIIIFKDPSHKFCLRHFRAQCRILKEEYNVTPIKLEI